MAPKHNTQADTAKTCCALACIERHGILQRRLSIVTDNLHASNRLSSVPVRRRKGAAPQARSGGLRFCGRAPSQKFAGRGGCGTPSPMTYDFVSGALTVLLPSMLAVAWFCWRACCCV
jgi:hypothetical protein